MQSPFIVLGLHGAPDVMKHAEKLVCQIVGELKRESRLELLLPISAKQETPCPPPGDQSSHEDQAGQVKASFRGGILEVRLPKLVVVKAQRVTVE